MARPRHPDILTPREWEVLRLVRRGYSNREIAVRLGISPAGAKYHVAEILGKLGAGGRQDVALLRLSDEGQSRELKPAASGWELRSCGIHPAEIGNKPTNPEQVTRRPPR